MEKLTYYNVYIDGIDKAGKDTVNDYITRLADFKYLNKSRGLLTMIAYAEKFNRHYEYDLDSMRKSVHVLLDVEKHDWEARCKIANEPKIDYDADVKLFDKAYKQLKEAGYKVYRFNTSYECAYQIAIHILVLLDRLNEGKDK